MSVPLSPPPLRPFETKEALIEWITVTVNSKKKREIKKPPTGFICFRKWFNRFILPVLRQERAEGMVAGWKGPKQEDVSEFVGVVWDALPDSHQSFWRDVAKDVKEYHLKRYPAFYSPESLAKREEEKRQRKEEEKRQPRKAKKPANTTKPRRRGRKRSPKGAVRSSPYQSQQTQRLPSSSIHPSNPPPLHTIPSLTMPVQSSPVDAFLPSIPAYRSATHPAMYVPLPSSSMPASLPFAVPPSFHPPSATLPFSATLPSSSLFAPPQSWPLHQQHRLPPAAPALPLPLTSALPAAPPAAFPPQAFKPATLGVPPSIPAPSGPQRSENDIDFLSFFEAPQGGAMLGMPPLPMDNLSVAQQPTFAIPSTFLDVGMLDLPNLPK